MGPEVQWVPRAALAGEVVEDVAAAGVIAD
jgi:hypothetical protein